MFTFLRNPSLLFIIVSLPVPVVTDNVALLVIDVQNCFLPTGTLPVTEGDLVIPIINEIRQNYDDLFSLVVFSQDWHCDDHVSFASQHNGKNPYDTTVLHYNSTGNLCESTCDAQYNITQVLWPDHCIKNTADAKFASNITRKSSDVVVQKGYHCKIDSYSAFFDNGEFSQTELNTKLKEKNVDTVIIVGLALDYCVYYTAKDAKKLGYKVYVVQDATRAVANATSIDALHDMKERGVHIVKSSQMPDLMEKLTSSGNIPQCFHLIWYIAAFVISRRLAFF